MIATNAIRGVLILLIPIIQVLPVVGNQAWPLIVITFLFSSVGQLFAPAEAASIPRWCTATRSWARPRCS